MAEALALREHVAEQCGRRRLEARSLKAELQWFDSTPIDNRGRARIAARPQRPPEVQAARDSRFEPGPPRGG